MAESWGLQCPEKNVLEKYQKEFGDHHCDDCIKEDIPYKLIVGTQTSCQGVHIPICRNKLVPFNGNKWWEWILKTLTIKVYMRPAF